VVEELMWMLTLFGHQHFSDTRGRANKQKQIKIKLKNTMSRSNNVYEQTI
jgi:hypothetical protein